MHTLRQKIQKYAQAQVKPASLYSNALTQGATERYDDGQIRLQHACQALAQLANTMAQALLKMGGLDVSTSAWRLRNNYSPRALA